MPGTINTMYSSVKYMPAVGTVHYVGSVHSDFQKCDTNLGADVMKSRPGVIAIPASKGKVS